MADLYQTYIIRIDSALLELKDHFEISEQRINDFERKIADIAFADIKWLSEKDPAAHNNHEFVFDNYTTAKAILNYRIANALYYDNEYFIGSEEDDNIRLNYAHKIFEKTATETHIEIHPAAKIGSPFSIDHGFGTSIDKNVEIGSNCYVLNGIQIGETGKFGDWCCVADDTIFGAANIIRNKEGKRHPIIGNNVTIGAGVRIWGSVTIGDNVFIAPKSIITRDIPDNSDVYINNQVQIVNNKGKKALKIYGVVPKDDIIIYGAELDKVGVSILDVNYNEIEGLTINTKMNTDFNITIDCDLSKQLSGKTLENAIIRLEKDNQFFYITNAVGLKDALMKLNENLKPVFEAPKYSIILLPVGADPKKLRQYLANNQAKVLFDSQNSGNGVKKIKVHTKRTL